MKIVHFGYNIDGGAGLGMLRLHRDLLARGIDSRVVCMRTNANDPTVARFPDDLRNRGFRRNVPAAILNRLRLRESPYYRALRVSEALKAKYKRTVSIPFSLFSVEEHPFVQDADIVHLHWATNFVDLPSFFRNVGRPVVWTVRDENPFLGYWHFRCDMPKSLTEAERSEDDWLREEKTRAIRSCGTLAIASLSRRMDEFAASRPAAEGRIRRVIPNSVDGSVFHPADGEAVRREYGIGDGTKLLLFVSQTLNDPRKGLSELLPAVSSLQRTDLVVLCVGSGKPPPTPKNVRVIFEGRVTNTERLSALFSASDLFVTPSHAETFGKTTTESLACGTPVVSYPNAGALDIVGPDDGVLTKDFTTEALRDAIDEALSRRFDGAALRARVLERFSQAAVADAYIALYERVLSDPSESFPTEPSRDQE